MWLEAPGDVLVLVPVVPAAGRPKEMLSLCLTGWPLLALGVEGWLDNTVSKWCSGSLCQLLTGERSAHNGQGNVGAQLQPTTVPWP